MAIAGAATIRKARRHDRSMLLFALFPAIFSLHQFIEGFVWLSVGGAIDGEIFRYAYIFIAVLLWPVLTPLAAAVAETSSRRKRIHVVLFAAGLSLVAYLTVKFAGAKGIDVVPAKHSLHYFIRFDEEPPIEVAELYAVVTVIPLLVFRDRIINVLGVLVGASFLYSVAEQRQAWFSLWCFMAAVFSLLLYFSIRMQEEKDSLRHPPRDLLFRF